MVEWFSNKGGDVEKAYSVLEKVFGRKSIYIITTDTKGSDIKNANSSSLWTWDREGGGNGVGHFFKFNIGISNNGSCHIPTAQDMISTIRGWVGSERFDEEYADLSSESRRTRNAAISQEPRDASSSSDLISSPVPSNGESEEQ